MVEDTSLLAYFEEKVSGRMGDREQMVYDVLKHFNKPMTDRQIMLALGFEDMNAVRPRRNGLMNKGLVIESGKVKDAFTGKLVKQWSLK